MNFAPRMDEALIDAETQRFAIAIAKHAAKELVEYRSNLVSGSVSRSIDFRRLSGNQWESMTGKTKTKQAIVSVSRGLGHVAAVMRVEIGTGIYHKAGGAMSGEEVCACLSGEGFAFYDPGEEWTSKYVTHGFVGGYDSSCGHAIVNTGNEPLILLMVSLPMNQATQFKYEPSAKDRQVIGAAEFDLCAVHSGEARIPLDLQLAIAEKMPKRTKRAA